jgi:hypothetical protein
MRRDPNHTFILGTPVLMEVNNIHNLSKVGIRNFGPHLRNSAILRTTKTIAELRTKKSCGTAIADLQNLTSAIPQLWSLRPVQLLSYPFS